MSEKVENLVDVIRSRVLSAQLPRYLNSRVFAGPGDGLVCVCCDAVIERRELEYELEIGLEDDSAPPCVMHLQCYQLWFGVLRSLEIESTHLKATDTPLAAPADGERRVPRAS
jgi:hypothetical protein